MVTCHQDGKQEKHTRQNYSLYVFFERTFSQECIGLSHKCFQVLWHSFGYQEIFTGLDYQAGLIKGLLLICSTVISSALLLFLTAKTDFWFFRELRLCGITLGMLVFQPCLLGSLIRTCFQDFIHVMDDASPFFEETSKICTVHMLREAICQLRC